MALGAAITGGERNFVTIVAVRGENGEAVKIRARDLLPFAYQVED